MIRIHILGAGGAVPTATHSPAAYLVTVDGSPLLLDPGPGALVRHARSGEAPNGLDDLDRVLITHLHPDHCSDLAPLLFALHSVVLTRTDPFHLIGPVGLIDYLEKLRGIYGAWLDPRFRELLVRELEPGETVELPGGGQAAAFAARHPKDRLARQPLGFVLSDRDGRRLVFSGDTEPCPGLEEAARGADLLLVECSTPDELATSGHMTPSRIGALCATARPARVVLTHQYPAAAAVDLAAAIRPPCACPVLQARDGTVVEIPETDKERQ